MALTILEPVVNAQINSLILDASIEESHSYECESTDFPVEDGSINSDHIIKKPVIVSIKGLITNNNIDDTTAEDRVTNAKNYLLTLRENNTLVTLVTKLQVYSNMVMTKITFDRNKNTVYSLPFSADFKQLNRVTTEIIAIEKVKNGKVAPNKNVLKTDGEEPTAAQKENASTLYNIFSGFKNKVNNGAYSTTGFTFR